MSENQTADETDLFWDDTMEDAEAWVEGVLCVDCGKYPADLPSKLCPGCEAYREHSGQI